MATKKPTTELISYLIGIDQRPAPMLILQIRWREVYGRQPKEDRLAEASKLIGRPIKSFKDLTDEENGALVEALNVCLTETQ